VIILRTENCFCGQKLDSKLGKVVQKCQVFDLPQPKLEVTEYQVVEQVSTCGYVHRGQLPVDVRQTLR
jgi:hypothetical protein